jgi:alkylhydroperoxidase family enzyme
MVGVVGSSPIAPTNSHPIVAAKLDAQSGLKAALAALEHAVFDSRLLPPRLARELFVVASVASCSPYCQAHGAIRAARDGVPVDRIQALWDFERSPLFSDAERAAFRLVKASALVPSELDAAAIAEVLKFWSQDQIKQMSAVSCLAAWRQRRAAFESATLDRESVAWAKQNLGPLGWQFEAAKLPVNTPSHTQWRGK